MMETKITIETVRQRRTAMEEIKEMEIKKCPYEDTGELKTMELIKIPQELSLSPNSGLYITRCKTCFAGGPARETALKAISEWNRICTMVEDYLTIKKKEYCKLKVVQVRRDIPIPPEYWGLRGDVPPNQPSGFTLMSIVIQDPKTGRPGLVMFSVKDLEEFKVEDRHGKV